MFWLWKGKCFSKVIFLPWIHRCIEGKLWKYDTAHRYAQRQRFPHQPSSTQKLICNWSNFSIGVQLKDIELTVLWTFLDPTWESCWNRLEQMAWLEFWKHRSSATGPPQLASYNAKQIHLNHNVTTAKRKCGNTLKNIWMHWLIVGPQKTWRMFHQHLLVKFCE